MHLITMPLSGHSATVLRSNSHKVTLDVRPRFIRGRSKETSCLEEVRSSQPCVLCKPLGTDRCLAMQLQFLVVGNRLQAVIRHDVLNVVTEVSANPRRITYHWNAVLLQLFLRANAGQHQQLRGLDGACRKNDLTVASDNLLLVFAAQCNTNRFITVKNHTTDECARDHCQIRAGHRRVKVCARSTFPDSVMNGHVHPSEAFLAITVLIVDVCMTRLLSGLYEDLVQRACTEALGHMKRPRTTTVLTLALVVGFRSLEVWETVSVRPVRKLWVSCPVVEVHRVATDVDHPIDRRRPT